MEGPKAKGRNPFLMYLGGGGDEGGMKELIVAANRTDIQVGVLKNEKKRDCHRLTTERRRKKI